MPTLVRLDGTTQEVSAEEVAALTRQPTPVSGGTAAPGLEPPPAVGGPAGTPMSPEAQREALLNLLPVLGGLLAPMLGPSATAGTGLMRFAPAAVGVGEAALGGAAGQGAADAARVATGAESAPASVGEAASRAGGAAFDQGVQEVGGRIAGRVAQGAVEAGKQVGHRALGSALPFTQRVTDLGREVIDTVQRESSRYAGILTPLAQRLGLASSERATLKLPLARPSNVTASKAIDLLTRISESAPLSRREVALRDYTQGGASAIVKKIADDFGAHALPNELGAGMLASNWRLTDAHKLVENGVWNHLLAESGSRNVRVPVRSLNRLVAPLRAIEKEIQKIGSMTDAGGIAEAIKAMVSKSPDISFAAAKVLRQRLSAEVERIHTLVGGNVPAKGTISKLRKQLDADMRAALGKQAPDLAPIFDTANRLTKERARDLQNPLVQNLVNKVAKYTDQKVPVFEGPLGDIPATVFSGTGAAGKIEQFRNAVDPQTFEEMANSWVQWELSNPNNRITGSSVLPNLLNGENLRKAFSADGPNGETLAALFKTRPGDLDCLRKWTDVLAATQLRPGEGGQIGTLAIMGTQWGAVAFLGKDIITGELDLTDPATQGQLGIILTPPIMSRMMNSPVGYQLLTRSVAPATTTREGAKLLTKINQQYDKIKAGLTAVERAYSDNVEMQIRQSRDAPAGPQASPAQLPAQTTPTPLAAAG